MDRFKSMMMIFLVSASAVGCANYQSDYYAINANQWQHMPYKQQSNAIYAYNSEQKIKKAQQVSPSIAGFEVP